MPPALIIFLLEAEWHLWNKIVYFHVSLIFLDSVILLPIREKTQHHCYTSTFRSRIYCRTDSRSTDVNRSIPIWLQNTLYVRGVNSELRFLEPGFSFNLLSRNDHATTLIQQQKQLYTNHLALDTTCPSKVKIVFV